MEELKKDVAELREDMKEIKVTVTNHITKHEDFEKTVNEVIDEAKGLISRFGAKKYLLAAGGVLTLIVTAAQYLSEIIQLLI